MSETEKHVHDCTGPGMKCPCGYVFTVPPVSVSLDVFNRSEALISDGFSCGSVNTVANWLREMADRLERKP